MPYQSHTRVEGRLAVNTCGRAERRITSFAPISLPEGKAKMNASTSTDRARSRPQMAVFVNERKGGIDVKSGTHSGVCKWRGPILNGHGLSLTCKGVWLGRGMLAVVIARWGFLDKNDPELA